MLIHAHRLLKILLRVMDSEDLGSSAFISSPITYLIAQLRSDGWNCCSEFSNASCLGPAHICPYYLPNLPLVLPWGSRVCPVWAFTLASTQIQACVSSGSWPVLTGRRATMFLDGQPGAGSAFLHVFLSIATGVFVSDCIFSLVQIRLKPPVLSRSQWVSVLAVAAPACFLLWLLWLTQHVP